MAAGDTIPDGLMDEVADALAALEGKMGKRLGDATDPLLVSVRSGAAFSMPGMMDTVLNLGLNDVSVGGLAQQTGNPRFAYDSYRRFVQMFGKIVLDIDGDKFEHALEELRTDAGRRDRPRALGRRPAGSRRPVQGDRARGGGHRVPAGPEGAARSYAIEAVFRSWNGERARIYRKMEKIPDDLGTAVNVQTMVFGNKGDDSGTGVAFTRDPATGENRPYGDFLKNAQGEDVVAGIRTTEPLDAMGNEFPECHAAAARPDADAPEPLPRHVRHRVHHRAGSAVPAADARRQAHRGRPRCAWPSRWRRKASSTSARRCCACSPRSSTSSCTRSSIPTAKYTAITKGLNASPGAAVGKVYFTADDAEAHHEAGEHVILVRPETSPDDLHGMIAAEGILTSRGGLVSHAAVVARGMGTPAVCGANELDIDVDGAQFEVNGAVVREGDVISINGTTGEVVIGAVAGGHPRARRSVRDPPRLGRRVPPPEGAHQRRPAARRAGGARASAPRASASAAPSTCSSATACRSCSGSSSPTNPAEEQDALDELEKLQRSDFEGIFEAMDGLPVTIRLLDPPLHEFLPDVEELLVRDAKGELDARGPHAARRRAAVAGGQPDARHARVPPRHHQARPLPDAGEGDHRGGASRARRRAATRTSRS